MKKKLLQSIILLLSTVCGNSQDFLGISTGNYAGVTGVLLQPASIADSRYKFDINIFSTGVNYSNNYFLLSRDAILKFNKNNFNDYRTFKARYLTEANLGAGERAFFNITNRTQLPLSFMVTLSKKSAIAFNMQSRSMIQGRNITQDLAQMAYNGFYYNPLNNRPLDASGLSINSLNWIEACLTYARVLYSSEKHFVKAAITGKYLGGVASLNLRSDNFRIGVNTDSSINFTATNFRYNHNEKADFNMVFDKNFRPDATALGFDAGLVYEYRGNLKNNRYIRNDDEISYEEGRRDVNKYIFKLGVSLLDMGMFSFNKPANVQSFNASVTGWDVRNGNYNTIKQFDTALAARVSPIAGDARSYNVYLPAALSVQLDIRFVKGLYLNAMAYRPLATGAGAGVRFDNYGYYAITPRYERRHFGIYLPYSFSDRNSITNYRENRLGATLRLGPLFIGSSNLGTMLFNNNLSAADVHVGLKLGITYGKPSKVSQFFEKKTTMQVLPVPVAAVAKPAENDSVVYKMPDTIAKNRVVVDYGKGLVYQDNQKGSIIIINNNYYYDTSNRAKNIEAASQVSVHNADSVTLRKLIDSLRTAAVKQQNNTAEQKFRDSMSQKKIQLDSLIQNLQQLRQQMDSSDSNGVNDRSLLQAKDTLANISRRQKNADSLSTKHINDSLSIAADGNSPALANKQQSAKKKVADSNGSTVSPPGEKRSVTLQMRDTSTKIITTVSPDAKSISVKTKDEMYQQYLNESLRLQQEINSIRQQVNNNSQRNYLPAAPSSYPVALSPQVYTAPVTAYQPPATLRTVRDTIYVRDTIRILDTMRLTDTLTVADTLRLRDTTFITTIKKSLHSPVKADTVIEKTDYHNLPPENILFASGQFAVRKVYNNKLNYLVAILQKNPALKLSITGHTDPNGPVVINEALSLKRALAVKDFFTEKGIEESRLITGSAGSANPVIAGTSKEANSQNRRVVIKIN